jgi:hypothetical protein
MPEPLEIHPYRWNGLWVFDDPARGLEHEEFVAGADTLIDKVLAELSLSSPEKGFRLFFCDQPFPEHQMQLDWRRADMDGNTYYSPDFDQEAWLCPSLLLYFSTAPLHLYMALQPINP